MMFAVPNFRKINLNPKNIKKGPSVIFESNQQLTNSFFLFVKKSGLTRPVV